MSFKSLLAILLFASAALTALAGEVCAQDVEKISLNGKPEATTQNDLIRHFSSPTGSEGGLGDKWVWSTALALAAVVGLIVGGAWLVKRFGVQAGGLSRSGAFLVKGRWHLGGRQYVTLVQVGRRMLLLGVTSQQVNLLTEMTDPGEIEHMLGLLPGHGGLADGFRQLLGGQRRQVEQALDSAASDEAARSAEGHIGELIGRVKSQVSRLKGGER